MQRLEVSGVVRLIYGSLGVKGLICYKLIRVLERLTVWDEAVSSCNNWRLMFRKIMIPQIWGGGWFALCLKKKE